MYEALGQVTLKTGETVQAGVVIGPDSEWAERVEDLLSHKGDPWNWQNSQALRHGLGIDVYYYLLHRDGVPLANIMTAELAGVGFLGHVWTQPEERRKGACSALMRALMVHFRARAGKALFLDTAYDSAAYHIYKRFGFEGVEPKSGEMDFYTTTKEGFERAYFAQGEVEIQPLGWPHWPASGALFLGDFAGLIRCAPLKLMGRQLTETPLLYPLHDAHRRQSTDGKARAMVLSNRQTTAVVGLVAWDWHPLWRGSCLVDVYCHPDYWERAGELWAALSLPKAERYVAYSEVGFQPKAKVLVEQDFVQSSTLKGRVPSTYAKRSFLDVAVFEKTA